MSSDPDCLIRSSDDQRAPSVTVNHPLNPRSEVAIRAIGRAAGLERIGVSQAVVPPGRESFIYHSHRGEEEWIYILTGSGTAIIDGEKLTVGPGDFMGFPTPSVAHTLVNSGDEDLVYLMGGEAHAIEIGEFPDRDQLVIRAGRDAWVADKEALQDMRSLRQGSAGAPREPVVDSDSP